MDWENYMEKELHEMVENLIDVEKYILSEVHSEMINEGKNTNLLLVFDNEEKRQDFIEIELINITDRIEGAFGEVPVVEPLVGLVPGRPEPEGLVPGDVVPVVLVGEVLEVSGAFTGESSLELIMSSLTGVTLGPGIFTSGLVGDTTCGLVTSVIGGVLVIGSLLGALSDLERITPSSSFAFLLFELSWLNSVNGGSLTLGFVTGIIFLNAGKSKLIS